ncbi:Hypothetical protein, putative [Bodo saltans]|uniref:Uncharacterized protein n=1 Tax=Bodo saltans TaxID=75058 RepID=A0A0S4IX75_BODSA|nr:Hypothetical protein, putative [Bodo saltans]|eukprot:CUF48827.1 Hypothetical protein, putative [Bodo saltans]
MHSARLQVSTMRAMRRAAPAATIALLGSSPSPSSYGLLHNTASCIALSNSVRWCSTASTSSAGASSTTTAAQGNLFDRTAAARREIHDLWAGSQTAASAEQESARQNQIVELIERYQLGPTGAKEEDIIRSLGESFDRLLLLCVPLGEKGAASLEALLGSAGRLGREIGIRTIQHLFSRCASYAEAIAIFYTLRRCNVNMNMESYYAMLYSLQRLEEESWALKFADELDEKKTVSEQAFDFMMQGCANQLLPENKPWIGNVMYADGNGTAPQPSMRASQEEYDKLGEKWTKRYKEGPTAGFVSSQSSA